MKHVFCILTLVLMVALSSCNSGPSLQEYYVDNNENPNFMSFDLPASILNIPLAELNDKQKVAVNSLNKLNILAFKKTDANSADYEVEQKKVNAILNNDKYTELMKMKTAFGNATVQYLGDEDAIDEVIVFGSDASKGFALVRVLGDDMNPAHLAQLLQAVEKSDYNGEGLERLGDFFKE